MVAALFLVGWFFAYPKYECVLTYDHPSEATTRAVIAARDELRERGYEADVPGDRYIMFRAKVRPDLLSGVGLKGDGNGPELEAAMAELSPGSARPGCFQPDLYD